ncbi:Glycosyltransferase [Rhodovastum atsumiense]|uniref:Glycosyltransferase n=1 Tax=Rhodovastum atsumiense TaxID=504468 RepID=A0A5M6J2G2_9PROT|nr:glycosyltransferase [Rhodovastum atsumiense]KAA5614694.1 glycosyltransferase [Rhodovastum atsumiense]CAH2599773.1 Glycosyltransferase [Rhodovastum atsumiense]
MTRVAHVMAGARNGGAELFFERLCLALHAAGDQVLPVIRTDTVRAARLRAGGLEPAQFPFGTPLDLLTRLRLGRALRGFAPRVVVSWMNRANLHTPRGDWVSVGRLGGYYDLRYYRRCDHLVGNTRGIVAWLRRQGWTEARTHYLPNFVTDFAATPPAADLPSGRPLLLGLGRLHTDKGFDVAIRALPHVPGAVLAIAGEGPELRALQTLARREGVAQRVRFLGWRHDAGALLKAADLFVCSSRIEPLGNMVIEAWSAGCPLVAAAAAGPAELVRDGEDGLLVGSEDPLALAEAIGALLESPARRAALAQTGRARFEAEFALTPVVARWQRFLAEVGN